MRYNRRALKRLMVERGIDARVLATRTGLTHQGIYTLARGMAEPKASTLGRLASALEVPVEAFFTRKACARRVA